MSYDQFETSPDKGEPLNLYLFQYGPTPANRIGMTDAETSVNFDGVTYQPEPVDRDTIKSSGTLDKSALNIRADRNNQVAELFRVYPPSHTVRLTIYQGHKDDPDKQFLVVWTGRVLNVKWINSQCQMSCEPISTSLRRPGLRRRYQLSCPHVLYGPICRANKERATTTTTLAEAANGTRTVKVSYTIVGEDARTLHGGTFEWITPDGIDESRTILAATADGTETVLTLSGTIKTLAAGTEIKLVRGCAHNLDDCSRLHSNLPNYGGMPWIPTKNPIGPYSPYY